MVPVGNKLYKGTPLTHLSLRGGLFVVESNLKGPYHLLDSVIFIDEAPMLVLL